MMKNPTKEIKESMKVGLVTIGVIIVVALIGWVSYEISTVRDEVARGMAWMSSFI